MVSIKRRTLLKTVAVGSTGVAGCIGGTDDEATTVPAGETDTPSETPPPSTSQGAPEPDATVQLLNRAFSPVELAVDTGATVEWVNEDPYGHDVTAAQLTDAGATWSFEEPLGSGAAVVYTFEASGVYEYYCTIHGKSTMCGVVLVGGETSDASLPCADGGPGLY